ncbi:MAG: hypothetical protein M3Z25_21155 [Actinomycetota bacterium]|nr:hypothetical protein [Actinomycetota bacterium]
MSFADPNLLISWLTWSQTRPVCPLDQATRAWFVGHRNDGSTAIMTAVSAAGGPWGWP